MKKSLVLFVFVLGALIALNSCKKEYLVDVNGTVNGNVREAITNKHLSKVMVSVIVNDKTVLKDSTDSEGYYSIKDVPSGYHQIVFSKSGYGKIRQSFYIDVPSEVENTTNKKRQSYEYGEVNDAILYPLIGKAKGIVTFNGVNVGQGVTVIANFTDLPGTLGIGTSYMEPSTDTTTTDANGAYTFNELPLGVNVTITAYNANASGSVSTGTLSLVNSVVPIVSNFDISEASLKLLNYTGKGSSYSTFAVDTTTTSIVLTFSENISEAITKAKGGYATISKGWSKILTTTTFSGNTVTITPVGKLSSGTNYDLDFEVYASDFKSVSSDHESFYTKARAAQFTVAPVLSYNASGLRITTGAVAQGGGTITYQLYYKTDSGTDADYEYNSTYNPGTFPYLISTVGNTDVGSYYILAKVTGNDGVTIYSQSGVAIKIN